MRINRLHRKCTANISNLPHYYFPQKPSKPMPSIFNRKYSNVIKCPPMIFTHNSSNVIHSDPKKKSGVVLTSFDHSAADTKNQSKDRKYYSSVLWERLQSTFDFSIAYTNVLANGH